MRVDDSECVTIAVGFAGYNVEIDFELDHHTRTWTPVEADGVDLLDEDAFPLIGRAHGRRFELHGDGTFVAVHR